MKLPCEMSGSHHDEDMPELHCNHGGRVVLPSWLIFMANSCVNIRITWGMCCHCKTFACNICSKFEQSSEIVICLHKHSTWENCWYMWKFVIFICDSGALVICIDGSVIMMVADDLVPYRHQAISNYHVDSWVTVTWLSHDCHMTVTWTIAHNISLG